MIIDSMPRLRELVSQAPNNTYNSYFNNFIVDFEDNFLMQRKWEIYNTYLESMDQNSWCEFKKKAYDLCELKTTYGWRQLIDLFSEAAAYYYAKNLGCQIINFIPTSNKKSPDIIAQRNNFIFLFEVKKINISDIEINRINNREAICCSGETQKNLMKKIEVTIRKAHEQIISYDSQRKHSHFIFIDIDFDKPLIDPRERFNDIAEYIHLNKIKENLNIEVVLNTVYFFDTLTKQI